MENHHDSSDTKNVDIEYEKNSIDTVEINRVQWTVTTLIITSVGALLFWIVLFFVVKKGFIDSIVDTSKAIPLILLLAMLIDFLREFIPKQLIPFIKECIMSYKERFDAIKRRYERKARLRRIRKKEIDAVLEDIANSIYLKGGYIIHQDETNHNRNTNTKE